MMLLLLLLLMLKCGLGFSKMASKQCPVEDSPVNASAHLSSVESYRRVWLMQRLMVNMNWKFKKTCVSVLTCC